MENHITTTNQSRPAITLPKGVRVPQYGPAWVEAVTSGTDVVAGNLLVTKEEEASE